jgi:NAD(P)-dependent dehydrogenase (short-subunit alcohol dehydrogenase family)
MARDFFGLTDKVAIVVGGGFGIGEDTALRLAEAGCHVAVVDIERGRSEAVAARIRALGRKALPLAANVLDESSAQTVVDVVERELGPPDVLTTIVGQAVRAGVLDITPEIWDTDHNRNVRYFVFYAQAAARAMVRSGRGGAITALASVTALQSGPGIAAYAAAKAALINFVRSMAVELAPNGIRVNAVAPGTIRTPRGEQRDNFAAWEQRIRDSLIPAARMGETGEVADGILFLSSQMASFVTGHVLAVDGGYAAQTTLGTA